MQRVCPSRVTQNSPCRRVSGGLEEDHRDGAGDGVPVATTLTGDDDRCCDVTVAIIPATVTSFAWIRLGDWPGGNDRRAHH